MIGRNAAVAEIGENMLTNCRARSLLPAWLGVHAALLTTARAKIETFVEWGCNYFGQRARRPRSLSHESGGY